MSEKRFTFYYERGNEVVIEDNGKRLSNKKVVDLLNEQQATNDYLEESNSRLQVQLGETLGLVDEQQATIRKLQDLCGKSDGENAKLRIENKRLCDEIKLLKPTNIEQYEQIQKLQEENEQLRQKLECCEYEHFKKELDKIHERVEKGDLSDFCTLTISDKGLEHWNGVLK